MKFIPKTWPRRISLGFLVVLLIGPFLIPVTTSGTLNYKDAAAPVWNGESKWMQLSGHEVHYVTAGDPQSDRLIVLMHGFGASAFSYKYVMEDLAELGYVVAYDRAAFGFTERPTEWELNPYGVEGQLQVLNELIAELGLNKDVVLVGHSAGGSLAASFVIENPGVVDELVLFAPAVLTSGGAPGWMNWIFSVPQIDHLGPLLVSRIATAGLDILYSSYYDESKVTAEILAGYTAPLKVEGWEQAFWEFNRAPRDETVGERLNEITIPTLIITGDTDKIVPTEDSIKVSQIIEGSQLVVIPRTGHLANEEAPSEFAEAISEFLSHSK
jgi:pimeloyl-ACP methyl ester carboxylesterase